MVSLTRRQFIGLCGATALGAGTARSAWGNTTTEALEVTERMFIVPSLPDALEGYRIGFLTDLHLGVCTSLEFIENSYKAVQEKGISLLLLGGDYLWIPQSPLAKLAKTVKSPQFDGLSHRAAARKIFATLADLTRDYTPKDGTYAVYGNHDRWNTPYACEETFTSAGVTLLKNQCAELSFGEFTLGITGVDDYLTGIPSLPTTLPNSSLRILLSHNPDYVGFLARKERLHFDLALCGHTHGGQIKSPLIGAPWCNIEYAELQEGLYTLNNTEVYTSRGIGTVELPVRINCPPEVVIYTLRKKGKIS